MPRTDEGKRPTGASTFYFLVPVGASDAPVGTALGFVVGAVCLVAIAGTVFNEVRQAAKRLRPVHLLLAFELVLVIFSLGYYLLTVQQPEQFSGLSTRLDALYFSMTTMSTVGHGDIHAQGQLARLLVTVQLVFNLVFVASLVSLFQDQIRRRGAREWLRSTSTGSTPEPPVDDDGAR